MTARWTIDDNSLLIYDDRILPIPVMWPDGIVAYAALVADVRAARLADDMAAALRELHSPDPRNYCIACGWKAPCATRQMADGFVPPGEVAALQHARATGDDQP
jgi:hypothetical protein